jgi:spore coat protein U-like protein
VNVYVYAQIPALQAFSQSGNYRYTDTVTATLSCNSKQLNTTLAITVQEVDFGCGISANSLNFGNYSGKEVDATTTIQVGCSKGTPYNVGLNAGIAAGATVLNRNMTHNGGTALLSYKLWQSSSGPNWGNTIGTDTLTGTASGTTQSLNVYGVIPAGQSVIQGTYTDTITATITY